MFTSDFNPFEILNKDEVQKNLNEIIDKVNKRESLAYGKIATRVALSYLANISTSWINALGKINEWLNKKELYKFHVAQLNYLLKHPEKLKNVTEANLAVCAIILYHSYSILQLGGGLSDTFNTVWYSLKNFSFSKGFEELQKDVAVRNEKNMWNIMLSPIALLMNQKYIIGENKSQCESFLFNIVDKGRKYSGVDSLCKEAVFESFMSTSILNYFKNNRFDYKRYMDSQSCKDTCDTIDSHIDFFLTTIEEPDRIGF